MAQSANATVCRTETVPEGANVRHYDELDERTQEFFLSVASEGMVPPGADLSRGDVVVFTDYYRVR